MPKIEDFCLPFGWRSWFVVESFGLSRLLCSTTAGERS
jgi:hypothetical protein